MKKLIGIFTMISFYFAGFGQGIYDNVGVIVNDNSQVSLEIGEYFKQSRNIPTENMIHIHTVTDEIIDTIEFRKIQYQVKNCILNQSLENKLEYLVTTKGVPFDIQVDSCAVGPPHTFTWCSSVESELTLLLSADSVKILKKNYFLNPYYSDTSHFSRQNYDLLLVSRLDGYTKQDVFDLIDRTGPNTYIDKPNGKFIFDISYSQDTNINNLFEGMMQPAVDSLVAMGWNAFLDMENEIPVSQENVIGFVGFFQEIITEELDYSWEKGSFSELLVTGPEFTFYDSLNYTGNLELANLTKEGCGGASGYVHPTWGSKVMDYPVFFTRYYSEKNNPFNLAESFYMATKTLSWGNILIGDPKTTITTQGGSFVENPDYFEGLTLFPNPATNEVNIRFRAKNAGEIIISVTDQLGKTIKTESFYASADRNQYVLNTSDLPIGLWFVGICGESGITEYRKIIVRK